MSASFHLANGHTRLPNDTIDLIQPPTIGSGEHASTEDWHASRATENLCPAERNLRPLVAQWFTERQSGALRSDSKPC